MEAKEEERGSSKRREEEDKRNTRGIVMGMFKDEGKMVEEMKTTSCFVLYVFPAAVMVRETDKRHFHRPSAVSEHQGASCSALLRLLLTRTQTKCGGKTSFFDENIRTSVVKK